MLRHLLILGGLLAGFFLLSRGATWQGPYVYDEADCMYAVSLGWRANWIDSQSLAVADFARLGLAARKPGVRADLSRTIRGRNDPLFYRHWHGPAYSDWLQLLAGLALDEQSTRAFGVVFPIAAAVLLYFGMLWLMPGAAGQMAAILAPALYLWSFPVGRTTELAPHQLFVLPAVAALLLVSKMFQGGRRPRPCWYGALAAAGFALCILEVGFALLLAVLACGYLMRQRLRAGPTFAFKSAAALLAPILLLWPAAVLKLSLLKAFAFMGYLAAFRTASWGSEVAISETWRLRFIHSPVPWTLFGIALVFLVLRKLRNPALIPFLLFSAIMFLSILRVNTDVPRYTLPLLPGLVLLGSSGAALLLSQCKSMVRISVITLICAAMFLTSWPGIRANLPASNKSADRMLALLRDRNLSGKMILVPHDDLPMLHYYFPQGRFQPYSAESQIEKELHAGPIDAVMFRAPVRLATAPPYLASANVTLMWVTSSTGSPSRTAGSKVH